jgi:hypothetical protein
LGLSIGAMCLLRDARREPRPTVGLEWSGRVALLAGSDMAVPPPQIAEARNPGLVPSARLSAYRLVS